MKTIVSAASSQSKGMTLSSWMPSAIQDSRSASRSWIASHSGSGVGTQFGFQ